MTMTKVRDDKEVLTTGEVAKICDVAPRTVAKWFDSGALRGYIIPGSKARRIPRNQLIRFMKEHNMPLNGFMPSAMIRVLIVDNDQDTTEIIKNVLDEGGRYRVEIAHSAFEAGIMAEKFRPHVILLDLDTLGFSGTVIVMYIKKNPDLQITKVVAISDNLTSGEEARLKPQGFDGFLQKPFHIKEVIAAIEDAINIIL